MTRRQPFSAVDSSSATHTVQLASGRIAPAMPVLVPRRFMTVAGRLAKHMAAPRDDVGPDQWLDGIDDGFVAGQCEEVHAALHGLGVGLPGLAEDMYAHQLLGTHPGVVAISRSSASRSSRSRDSPRRNAGRTWPCERYCRTSAGLKGVAMAQLRTKRVTSGSSPSCRLQ
jgi:hypothetical protein